MTEQKATWGYVRLSQQGRDGSIDEQKHAIREYCRSHDELDLKTTRNEGVNTSGFNADRDEYSTMRENIREENIDAVVVRDRARLSRDFDDRMGLLIDMRQHDTELHVIEAGGRAYINKVQNAAMEAVHAAMDEIKKRAEIRRSKEAMEERREMGAYQGGEPFGLRFGEDGKYLVADDDEIDDALRAIQLREEGESQRAVADEVGVTRTTVRNMMDRKEWYVAAAEGVRIGRDGPIEEVSGSVEELPA